MVWLFSGVFGLGVMRFGRFVVMLLMCHDAADVFLYRDSSISPLLDKRRWFKAVMDVLDTIIRYGILQKVCGQLFVLSQNMNTRLL